VGSCGGAKNPWVDLKKEQEGDERAKTPWDELGGRAVDKNTPSLVYIISLPQKMD
jgi:hypothetical protein